MSTEQYGPIREILPDSNEIISSGSEDFSTHTPPFYPEPKVPGKGITTKESLEEKLAAYKASQANLILSLAEFWD